MFRTLAGQQANHVQSARQACVDHGVRPENMRNQRHGVKDAYGKTAAHVPSALRVVCAHQLVQKSKISSVVSARDE